MDLMDVESGEERRAGGRTEEERRTGGRTEEERATEGRFEEGRRRPLVRQVATADPNWEGGLGEWPGPASPAKSCRSEDGGRGRGTGQEAGRPGSAHCLASRPRPPGPSHFMRQSLSVASSGAGSRRQSPSSPSSPARPLHTQYSCASSGSAYLSPQNQVQTCLVCTALLTTFLDHESEQWESVHMQSSVGFGPVLPSRASPCHYCSRAAWWTSRPTSATRSISPPFTTTRSRTWPNSNKRL